MHITQTYTYFGMHTFVAIERADTADSNEEESEDNDNEEEEDDEEDGSHLNPILVMVFFIVVELFWFRGGIFIAGPHCSPVKGRGGRGGVRKPLLCVIFEPLSFVLSLPADPAHNLIFCFGALSFTFNGMLLRAIIRTQHCMWYFRPVSDTHTRILTHTKTHFHTHTHTHTNTRCGTHTVPCTILLEGLGSGWMGKFDGMSLGISTARTVIDMILNLLCQIILRTGLLQRITMR